MIMALTSTPRQHRGKGGAGPEAEAREGQRARSMRDTPYGHAQVYSVSVLAQFIGAPAFCAN